jgi:acetylglutamate kinase
MERSFAGRTFVLRIDRSPLDDTTTLASDLAFLMQRDVRPIVVAPTSDAARSYVRALNRQRSVAVGLSGADAALLPTGGRDTIGRVQTGILATLTSAGYIPVIEPTAYAFAGDDDVALGADDVAAASAMAAVRAIFFDAAGGVVDPASRALLDELTPAEALALADRDDIDPSVRTVVRAAAHVVRGGVAAAQILDGRIAHAAIVEFLTDRHLGTQVTGTVYLGAA